MGAGRAIAAEPVVRAVTWLPRRWPEWRWFVWRQALSCLFPVCIFVLLAVTRWISVPGVPRYDALLIGCLLVQVVLLRLRYETMREFGVILAFHLIGLFLEIYKTHYGSWAYPGFSWVRIGGVPLYSGFMYASVASYICQAWRRLNLRLIAVPNGSLSALLAAAIYANFFTERIFFDLRWVLLALVFLHFRRTYVAYGNDRFSFAMPLWVGLLLVGIFVWLAENYGTLSGAWQYPNQRAAWQVVHPSKMLSWFLLVVIEFLVIARFKQRRHAPAVSAGQRKIGRAHV